MDVNTLLLATVLFFTKHFIVDFPLQTRYQYMNKGTYAHPGGILHAALHTVGTLAFLTPLLGLNPLLAVLSVFEGVVHYHIDWAKMNITRLTGWKCDNSEQFWWLLGFDQYLHYMTYAAMLWWLL